MTELYEYKNWSARLEVLSGTAWYEMGDIMRFLVNVRDAAGMFSPCSATASASASNLQKLFHALKCNAPFSQQTRFCEEKYYMYFNRSDATNYSLNEINYLLSYLNKFDSGRPFLNTHKTINLRTLLKRFEEDVKSLKIKFYNREQFETDFGLTWAMKLSDSEENLAEGVYTNWSPRAETFASLNWYNLNKIVKFVANARSVEFGKGEDTRDGLELYSELQLAPPFSKNSRFPYEEHYVSETDLECGPKLKSLCYMLRSASRSSPEFGHICEFTQDILDKLLWGKSYDRTAFEKESGLVWTPKNPNL